MKAKLYESQVMDLRVVREFHSHCLKVHKNPYWWAAIKQWFQQLWYIHAWIQPKLILMLRRRTCWRHDFLEELIQTKLITGLLLLLMQESIASLYILLNFFHYLRLLEVIRSFFHFFHYQSLSWRTLTVIIFWFRWCLSFIFYFNVVWTNK